MKTSEATDVSKQQRSSTSSTAVQDPREPYRRSRSKIVAEWNHKVNARLGTIIALDKKPGIRLSRFKSLIDLYFAEVDDHREKLMKFERQWFSTVFYEEARVVVKHAQTLMESNQAFVLSILEKRQQSAELESSRQRNVSFGETTVSTFTTSSEETPQSNVNTDSVPSNSDVHLVSSNSQKSSSHLSPKNTQSDDLNSRSVEDDFEREEEKKIRKLQRIAERQEKAKKKAEIEQKRLQMEFDIKQREHEEQMRQLDEKLQLRLL